MPARLLRTLTRSPPKMYHPPPPTGTAASAAPAYTPDLLRTWSTPQSRKPLPEREAVRAIHVYDFDNTLFQSPLPNSKIWHGPTLGQLQQTAWLANGGWWHDARILASTGGGADVEEGRAWEGWWNEHVVQLVRLSMEQKDALTILLTGRSEGAFAGLIQRIVDSKGLVFDMVVLKPDVHVHGHDVKNTLDVKCAFLQQLLNTYREAEELRIYEDRVKHVRAFEDWLATYTATTAGRRAHLKADVIQVAEESRCLPPSVELREVQKMITDHNAAARGPHALRIKKTVFYTGYLLNSPTTAALLNALEIPRKVATEMDVKLLANNVLITPRPASRAVLAKTGALGRRVEFEVTGVGCWENRVWAAMVKPVDPSIRIYTDNPAPIIVLAVRRSAKPIDAGRIDKWTPPPAQIRFWTVVGERLLLRVEEEAGHYEGEWESLFPNKRRSMEGLAPAAPHHGHGGQHGQHGHGQGQHGQHGGHGGHGGHGHAGQHGGQPPFGYQRERSMWA
ncbi:hypothetical protein EDC01DRAFT_680673 [Geopyxis carbonaria]|nr:hypothetical protein EDC01DRAFT_680673 [Geopyxis carbonaria]